jgi:hypothetical protein
MELEAMTKVPCVRCEALILPATAEATDGLCMPCSTGKREDMEAGKRWYREQRERARNDPLKKLWDDLVQRVHHTAEGLDGLSETEKQYYAVALLEGEVYNGGFDQYFFNNAGSLFKYVVIGLESMGASEALSLLLQAKHVLFGFEDVPENMGRLRLILRQGKSQSRDQRLDRLDNLFWKDPDGLGDRREAFARAHRLI